MTLVWITLGLVLGLVGFLYWGKLRKKAKSSPQALMKRLIRLTHDKKSAERLIAGEKSRQPQLSDIAILKRVIRRLERDRKR